MFLSTALTFLSDTITPPSMKRNTCTTCERELPLASFPKIPAGSECTHERETCRRCWHQWLEAQIKSKSFDQISCAQCKNILGQSQIRELATPAVYQKYLDSEFKTTLAEDADFRFCIANGCQSGQVHEGGNIFTCVSCKSKACVTCNASWHEDETCEVYQARVKKQPEDVRPVGLVALGNDSHSLTSRSLSRKSKALRL